VKQAAPETATICLPPPLQVNNTFVFIRQVAPTCSGMWTT